MRPMARYERICTVIGSTLVIMGIVLSMTSGKQASELLLSLDFRVLLILIGVAFILTVLMMRWNRMYLPDDKHVI